MTKTFTYTLNIDVSDVSEDAQQSFIERIEGVVLNLDELATAKWSWPVGRGLQLQFESDRPLNDLVADFEADFFDVSAFDGFSVARN